jgi:hypothetical protein
MIEDRAASAWGSAGGSRAEAILVWFAPVDFLGPDLGTMVGVLEGQ